MKSDLKKRFFIATVESFLLYGCESWTVCSPGKIPQWNIHKNATQGPQHPLGQSHTKRTTVWWVTSSQWQGSITSTSASDKVASRRLQLAGHCHRHPELSTQKRVLWQPLHGHERTTEDQLHRHIEEGHWCCWYQGASFTDGWQENLEEPCGSPPEGDPVVVVVVVVYGNFALWWSRQWP